MKSGKRGARVAPDSIRLQAMPSSLLKFTAITVITAFGGSNRGSGKPYSGASGR
ncbi:hypothetical protein FQZ97_612180 [compost metagenome]